MGASENSIRPDQQRLFGHKRKKEEKMDHTRHMASHHYKEKFKKKLIGTKSEKQKEK